MEKPDRPGLVGIENHFSRLHVEMRKQNKQKT